MVLSYGVPLGRLKEMSAWHHPALHPLCGEGNNTPHYDEEK
ncbi:MAG: hypothetical protein PHP13_06680 [Methanomicrobium sp.]|nr:hypothetical protein [Methanomicrobium sp.]